MQHQDNAGSIYPFPERLPPADGERDGTASGELLVDFDTHRILGAAAFRLRDTEEESRVWALQWIWITPIARRSGILSRYWPTFNEKYGRFLIEGPLSPAMLAFVEKRDLKDRLDG